MKMTRLLMVVLCTMVTLSVDALPVRPGQWATLPLAGGATVRAELCGNEYGTWYRDAQGQCYLREGDIYVEADWATVTARRAAARAAKRVDSRRATYASTNSGLGYKGRNSAGTMYSVGEYDIPVLMVEFSDTKFKAETTTALIQDYLTKEGFTYYHPLKETTVGTGSIRDYFVAQSLGMFKPNFKLLGKVTLDKSFRYYGQNNPQNPSDVDMNAGELAGDAITAAVAQLPGVDFKQFVIDPAKDDLHEAGIPLICMLYAGEAESNHANEMADDYQPDLLWPHQNDIKPNRKYVEAAGVNVNAYFVGNELSIDGQTLAGIGVFVHELGHALGLPDWYCTDNSYRGDDAYGMWSVMDSGCYVGEIWKPIGYTAYERSYMGWWSIPTYTESGHIKLNKPYEANDCAVFYINNDVEDTEYFILESRYPSRWYPTDTTQAPEYRVAFGSGLMVSRFAYDKEWWNADAPNNVKDMKRGLMITADGERLNVLAYESHLFGNGVNEIKGLKFYSGKAWDATISNITKNSDGSLEFDLVLGSGTGIENVEATDDEADGQPRYNLMGQRVGSDHRGIVVYKGKKYVRR